MWQRLRTLWEINHDITRHFDLDYIVFDAIFLLAFVLVLVKGKRWAPLRVGAICAVILYLIDGIGWYATGVREYGISQPWLKHPVDFMMDVSYGLVAFSWVWIAFQRRSAADVALWTLFLFGGWLLVSLLSQAMDWIEEPIMTVRHMRSQVWLQITVVAVGYVLLLLLRVRLATVLYVFCVGCMLAFMMEISLMVSGIRPPDVKVLVYETLILTNQGIPYLWVLKEKILPAIRIRSEEREVKMPS